MTLCSILNGTKLETKAIKLFVIVDSTSDIISQSEHSRILHANSSNQDFVQSFH